jgi:hypothetical protein
MKDGIYDDIDIKDYHENREIVSSTGLKQAKKSTRNFVWYVIHGTERKLTFDFGNAFEVALMDAVNGTKDFEETTAVLPTKTWTEEALAVNPALVSPKASKTYKELEQAFLEENQDKYLIPDVGSESKEWIDHMVYSCKSNPTIFKLLQGTTYQKSLVWTDPETGVKCKTRPDICMVKKNVVLDIKTTIDASPRGFAKQVANMDYPLQAVMQCQGCLHTGLMPEINKYFWLAVEKSAPFNVALYELTQDDLEYFTDEYSYILKRCAKGLKQIVEYKQESDIYKFASYGENSDNKHGIIPIEIPLWYKNEMI